VSPPSSSQVPVVYQNVDSPIVKLMPTRRIHTLVVVWLSVLALSTSGEVFAQLEFEGAPINYATAPVHDAVALLQQKLDHGEASLNWDDDHGWLPSVLEQLNVPQSSQLLVFSKTSLQLRVDLGHSTLTMRRTSAGFSAATLSRSRRLILSRERFSTRSSSRFPSRRNSSGIVDSV